jgi:hypothetical protein
MECILEANPVPEITWYQGMKVISDSNRVRMARKATGKDTYLLTLEISNPTKEDGGNYRCNAFNNFGESNANIALNFQGMTISDREEQTGKYSNQSQFTSCVLCEVFCLCVVSYHCKNDYMCLICLLFHIFTFLLLYMILLNCSYM